MHSFRLPSRLCLVLTFVFCLGMGSSPLVAQSPDELENRFRSLSSQGDYDEAAGVGIAWLKACANKHGKFSHECGFALNEIGIMLIKAGRNLEAEGALKQSLEIYGDKDGPGADPKGALTVMEHLAQVYIQTARFDMAERLLTDIRPVVEKTYGKESFDAANLYNTLGNLYEMSGHPDKAIPLLESALKIIEEKKGPNDPVTAGSLRNLARAQVNLGINPEKAERLLLRALAIDEEVFGAKDVNTARHRMTLAELYENTGREQEAYNTLVDCAEVFMAELGERHDLTASCYESLSRMFYLGNEPANAIDTAEKVVWIRKEINGEQHPAYVQSLGNLAILQWATGDISGAAGSFEKMGANGRGKLFGGSSGGEVLAYFHHLNGKTERAEPLLKAALVENESQLEKLFAFAGEQERINALGSSDGIRHIAATIGIPEVIANEVLQSKGRVLESLQAQRTSTNPETLELIEKLNLMMQTLAAADQAGEVIEGADEMVQQVEREISKRLAEEGLKQDSPGVSWQTVSSAIPKDSRLVEFIRFQKYVNDPNGRPGTISIYGAVVLSPNGGKPRFLELGATDEIDSLIGQFRSIASDFMNGSSEVSDRTIEPVLRDLYDKLLAPVFETAKDEAVTWYFSPDSRLHFVNFGALLTPENKFAMATQTIRYVGSGRDFLSGSNEKQKSELTPSVLLLGNPDYDHSSKSAKNGNDAAAVFGKSLSRGSRTSEWESMEFTPLSGTQAEVDQLTKVFAAASWKTQQLVQEAATEAALRNAISGHSIIHLATHGFFLSAAGNQNEDTSLLTSLSGSKNPGASPPRLNPMIRAGLALTSANPTAKNWAAGKSSSPQNDGIFLATEFSALDLSGVQLVTLSACETASGDVRDAEGVLGLKRAIAHAGADGCLLTLWPIADQETVDLMTAFYEELVAGAESGQALQTVQLKTLNRYRETEGLLHAITIAAPFVLTQFRNSQLAD